jgi:hypothetical protein
MKEGPRDYAGTLQGRRGRGEPAENIADFGM